MVKDLSGKHPNYYEAILQLRESGEEIVNFVEGEIQRGGIPLTKREEVEGGLDFYLADKNFTKALGKKLQEKFGGDYKITASIWGKKKGKEVYRLTVLFRGSGLKKGEKVEYKGEEHVIKWLLKGGVMLQKVGTGEKVQVKYKEKDKIRKKT